MPPAAGGMDEAGQAVEKELKHYMAVIRGLNTEKRITVHDKDIGSLVSWLGDVGKRSRMTVSMWRKLSMRVEIYFDEKDVKNRECHVNLMEKMVYHNGQPNTLLLSHQRSWCIDWLTSCLRKPEGKEAPLPPAVLQKIELIIYEMLKFPGHRAALTRKLMERCADLYLARLEEGVHGQSRQRALNILESVFLEMRRDEGQVSTKLSGKIFRTLQSLEVGDHLPHFFRALTQCLLTFAPDHFDKAKGLCSAVHATLKESWSTSGMDSKNRALIQYLLVFIRGQLATPDQVKECFDLLQSHICNISHRPIDVLGHGKSDMSSESRDLFELFADLLHLHLEHAQARVVTHRAANDAAQESPAKRMKPTPVFDVILGKMFTESTSLPNVNWLQFLCILTERYPADIPETFCCSVLEKMKTALTKKLEVTSCVWLCHSLVYVEQLLRSAPPGQLSQAISKHWEEIFRHTVEQLKARHDIKLDMVTGMQLRMLSFALSGRQLSASIVADCLLQIWGIVSYAIRYDFLKMPTSAGKANGKGQASEFGRVIWMHKEFAEFVGAVLRRSALVDSRNRYCSREALLSLIFDKIKEQHSGQVREWFSSVASMIVSTVCCLSAEASDREMSIQSHCLKAVPNEQYMWRDLSGAGSDEDIFRLRLNMLEEHMAFAGHLVVKSARSVRPVSSTNPVDTSTVLPRVHSFALQERAWGHLSTLITDAEEDGNQNKFFVPLATEILQAAVRMDTAEQCNERLLSKIAAVLLGNHMDDSSQVLSLHSFVHATGSFKMEEGSLAGIDSMLSYFDALFDYRDAVPGSFEGDENVSSLVSSVCKSCVEVLKERDSDAAPVDDEFDEQPVSNAGHGQDASVKRKMSALNLLLKLGHVQGDCFTASEASAIGDFLSCESRSWLELMQTLDLLIRYPIVLMNPIFIRLMDEISLGVTAQDEDEAATGRACVKVLHPQRRETVVPLAIALLAESCSRHNISGDHANAFLKQVRPRITHYAKTLADFQRETLDKQQKGTVIYPQKENPEEKKKALIGRDLRRTFLVCVGRLMALPDANLFTVMGEGQEQGNFLKTMLQCLQDRAWDVRQTLAGICPSFFLLADPWKVYKPIKHDIQAEKDAASTSLSTVRTRVRTLGNIIRLSEGIIDEAVECNLLYMLCVLCGQFPSQQDMIVSVVTWAAACREFSGPLELFSVHMPAILRMWVNGGKSWKEFPFTVPGYDTMLSFIRSIAAETLVPEFAINMQKREMEEMGKILDPGAYARKKDYLFEDNLTAILVRYFHLLWATQCDACTSESNKKSKTLDKMLGAVATFHQEHMSKNKYITDKCSELIDQVLIELLDKIVFGLSLEDGNEFSAKYTETNLGCVVLKKAFEGLGKWVFSNDEDTHLGGPLLLGLGQMNGTEDPDVCTDRLQRVTLHFMGVLSHARRLKQKERVVGVIEVLLDVLGDTVFQEDRAWAMQHIVWLLLVAMSDETILLKSARVLDDKIVSVVVSEQDKSKRAACYRTLAPVMLDVICTIYPYCINPRFDKLYRELVNKLIVNAPEELDQTVIKHLPPFPEDVPFFKKVRERFDRTRKTLNWTVEDDILLFLEGSDHVHTEVQKVRLDHFAKQLHARDNRIDLIRMHQREATSENGEELTKCVSKLLRITHRASSNSEIPSLVAQCLGHIGPVVSRSLSLSILRPSHLPTIVSKVSARKRELEVKFDNIWVAILETLHMFLADRSFEVVSTASQLLKDIFQQEWAEELLVSNSKEEDSQRIQEGKALDKDTNQWTHPYQNIAVGVARKQRSASQNAARSEGCMWLPGDTLYLEWISKLAHRLCLENSNMHWKMCADMCFVKPEFAELIFPHLLFSVDDVRSQSENQELSANLKALLSSENKCVQSVKLALNVLDFFRSFHQDVIQEHRQKPQLYTDVKKWKTRYWFDIPYNVAASASLRCDSPLTAILYMELFYTEGLHLKKSMRRSTTFDFDNERNQNEVLKLNAYRQIDEPDGLHAFNKQNDFHSHVITYEQEEEWGKSLGLFDTLLSSNSDHLSTTPGVSAVMAMHKAGYNHLPLLASRNLPRVDDETKCETLWRSGVLDLAEADTGGQWKDEAKGFNGHLLDALRALEKMGQNQGEKNEVVISIDGARSVALKELSEHDLQSTKKSHPVLVRLQCCQDVADVATVLEHHAGREDRIRSIVEQWGKWYKSMQNRFVLQEPSIALHGVLLSIVNSGHLQEQLCLTAKHALKQGNISYARCAMLKLQHRLSRTGRMRKPDAWWLTEAKVLWGDRRKDQAMSLMSDLESHLKDGTKDGMLEDENDARLLAKVLKVNAEWLSVSRTARWADIKDKMEEGVQLRDSHSMSKSNALFKLAAFFDGMYCQDEEDQEKVMKKQSLLTQRIQEMQAFKDGTDFSSKSVTTDAKNDKKNLNLLLMRNKEELNLLQEHQRHRREFMLGAMVNYLNHLQGRGTQKRAVFRVLQIWFENSHLEEVNKALCEKLEETSTLTNNFAILVPQLVSRLDSVTKSNVSFQNALRAILSSLLESRPDDTLFPLFAAKNESRARQSSKAGMAGVQYAVNQDRVDAASKLLDGMVTEGLDLKTPDGKAKQAERKTVLEHTEALVEAYIELADFDISTPDGVPHSGTVRSKMQRIKWTEDDSMVKVPTSQTGSKVAGFDSKWVYPGGITRPKQITCKGTDGMNYKQIVKGGDDQRCDAVTSQLFEVMGMLLRQDDACCRRQLSVRTYKVIPLHPQAGLLEFVDAVALSKILGDAKRRKGERPDEESLRDRFRIGSKWEKYSSDFIATEFARIEKSTKKKTEFFREVIKNTEPVFHHYFLERSWSAPTWFQRRLAYTRSVASTSMAGFVVGLGDRHTSNTLMIEATSELLNIDLGIVFDQGQLLAVPELVPFRLTREVVDGFGVAGTEGVFTRCCEETLRVLRDNKEDLLAIVDVLLHDPLMSWRMSTNKAAVNRKERALQAAESEADSVLKQEEQAIDAKMVRKQVKDKLEGRHRSEHLGVEGQVKQLILDARSEEHLSQIFRGWMPWL